MNQDAAWQKLQALLDREVVRNVASGSLPRRLRVLEAGCGSMSHVSLGASPHVVGVDLSERQLRRNETLDLTVLGDLHHLPLADGSFDVVVCWDVLEHLHTPRSALEQMARALYPGGHLVLGFPNLQSMKGLLTRWTPHSFHVWVYRHVLGSKTAGTNDHGPFRTYLRPEATLSGIQAWARSRGMDVGLCLLYQSEMQARMIGRNPLARAYVLGLGRVVQALTGGRIRASESDVILVLQKKVE